MTPEARRALHPEVDWRTERSFYPEAPSVIHPRSTGRNYTNAIATPSVRGRCICGAMPDEHEPDCDYTGCNGYEEQS